MSSSRRVGVGRSRHVRSADSQSTLGRRHRPDHAASNWTGCHLFG